MIIDQFASDFLILKVPDVFIDHFLLLVSGQELLIYGFRIRPY